MPFNPLLILLLELCLIGALPPFLDHHLVANMVRSLEVLGKTRSSRPLYYHNDKSPSPLLLDNVDRLNIQCKGLLVVPLIQSGKRMLIWDVHQLDWLPEAKGSYLY